MYAEANSRKTGREKMPESKFKRLVVALTAGAVILIIFLLSMMIYQLAEIGVQNRKREELKAEIAEYNRLISEGKDKLELRSTRLWIERRARELNYTYEDDVPLD